MGIEYTKAEMLYIQKGPGSCDIPKERLDMARPWLTWLHGKLARKEGATHVCQL
jgi:hypothetical protein